MWTSFPPFFYAVGVITMFVTRAACGWGTWRRTLVVPETGAGTVAAIRARDLHGATLRTRPAAGAASARLCRLDGIGELSVPDLKVSGGVFCAAAGHRHGNPAGAVAIRIAMAIQAAI